MIFSTTLWGSILLAFSAPAAAIAYFLYIRFSQQPPVFQQFSFLCICGAFHWIPFTIVAYATMFSNVPSNLITFAISFASAYLLHGLILITLTSAFTPLLISNQKQTKFKTWLRHQMIISCHLRFASFSQEQKPSAYIYAFWVQKLGSIVPLEPSTQFQTQSYCQLVMLSILVTLAG